MPGAGAEMAMKTETGLLPVGLLRTVRGHAHGRGSGQLFDCSYGQNGGTDIEVLTDRGTSHGLRATGYGLRRWSSRHKCTSAAGDRRLARIGSGMRHADFHGDDSSSPSGQIAEEYSGYR